MLSEHKGHHCQHRSDDFPTIAAILRPHRPRLVVELGTDEGGFSGWLADLVRPWGGVVHTFDIARKFKRSLLRDFTNLNYHEADVLGTGPAGPAARCAAVANLLRPQEPRAAISPILLYCDNGDKPREVELYAPLLPVGAILGVHDYNTEIMASWVEPFVAALGFEPEGHAQMEALRNEWYPEPMSRFWVRRRMA